MKSSIKLATNKVPDTPVDTPLASGLNTPRLGPDTRHLGLSTSSSVGSLSQVEKKRETPRKVNTIEYDSDIDPDDLLPKYLECKEKLFQIQSSSSKMLPRQNGKKPEKKSHSRQSTADPESAKILRKIKKIEDDILFDRYVADQQWAVRRIQLEKDGAARRITAEMADNDSVESVTLVDSDDEISREAAKISAELLEEDSDDDTTLADLFASLPVNEVDPLTGKSSTVMNGANGVKITIRDFGKWTGVSPSRVLEEACRAR